MQEKRYPSFAPQLIIKKGVKEIDFYNKAFDAVELRRFSNEDGSIHVAELSIGDMIFHLHEENQNRMLMSPQALQGTTTVMIGLFVKDADAAVKKAIAAGATLKSPLQSFDYGYRQGEIVDPFGHHWLIEMEIQNTSNHD